MNKKQTFLASIQKKAKRPFLMEQRFRVPLLVYIQGIDSGERTTAYTSKYKLTSTMPCIADVSEGTAPYPASSDTARPTTDAHTSTVHNEISTSSDPANPTTDAHTSTVHNEISTSSDPANPTTDAHTSTVHNEISTASDPALPTTVPPHQYSDVNTRYNHRHHFQGKRSQR